MTRVINNHLISSFLEEESEQVKKLQPPAIAAPLPRYEDFAIKFNGSIERSTAEKDPQFRPQLPRPEFGSAPGALARIIRCQARSDALTSESLDLLEGSIEQNLARLDALQKELKAALEEECQTQHLESKWHALETLVQYLTTASSIVLGAGLLLSGADQAAGACLLAAGGLGLFNQLMTDTRGWTILIDYFTESVETKKNIESQIQTGMFLLSTGLALASGAFAMQAGVPPDLIKGEEIVKIIMVAASLLTAGSKIAAGATKKRACDIQAKIIRINAESTDLRKSLELEASEMNEDQRKTQEIISVVKKAIEQLSTSD